ncbi:MAG: arylesterase [bacterium]
MKDHARRRNPHRVALLLACLWLLPGLYACERKAPPDESGARAPAAEAPREVPPPPPNAFDRGPQVDPSKRDTPVILVLGDSLAAGAGITLEQSFPSVLQNRLREAGYPHRVVNAGVSGDTTAGGLARLDWVFRQRIDWMIVELGGNDGLRGQTVASIKANLSAIIEKTKARGIPVMLAGMQMPENYGPDYTRRFREAFSELAKKHQIALIPFLLKGVAMRPALNQPDGIHPTAEGARIVAGNVWEVLQPLLRK